MLWFKPKPKGGVVLFNTLGRKKEVFEPLKTGHVKMYSCGPTVYGHVHIGNLRAAVVPDIIRRTLEYAGYEVFQVMNVTDFGHLVGDGDDGEDKMAVALKREGMALTMENMRMIASRYTDAFKDDVAALGVKAPRVLARASEHVPRMIAYVQTLFDKGYAYTTHDGVYFDVHKFPSYGALGGSASAEHSRIGVSTEKHDPRDFALWKFNAGMGWDAPWGRGFPGWHIECTAMSTRYLGKTFDIHTGGIDHIPVHHTNEIAQAEAANGKPYARYWMHNEFVTVDGAKLSKSLGNTITLSQIVDRGIPPLAFRYWLMTGHYRSPMNFTWEAVGAAKVARERLLKIFNDLPVGGSVATAYQQKFAVALNDDLNTPAAIAVLWDMVKDETVPPAAKRATILDMEQVLALGLMAPRTFSKVTVSQIPENVQTLVEEREAARTAGDYARADELRASIMSEGCTVDDTPSGPVVHCGHIR